MKIAIATLGTRGDVQPYLALAKQLQARGHQVTLAAPENFAPWVARHKVPFHSLGVDFEAMLRTPQVKELIAGKWTRIFSMWRSVIVPMVQASLDATLAATRGSDVLIFHPKAVAVPDVAEATGALAISASPIPMVPTADFPLWVTGRQYPRLLNRFTWQAIRMARAPYAGILNRWRRNALGLGKGKSLSLMGGMRLMHLCAVSPSVLPKPGDWDENSHMVGYWFLNEGADRSLSTELETFLSAGDPPVYLGLGSMPTGEPSLLVQRFADACLAARCRLIVARGWGGLERVPLPDHVFMLDEAPHDTLFPRVQAVIHHGGAGTTAAGLRAGQPTLIFPQIGDQAFWGKRVELLGCGPRALRRGEVHSRELVDRIRDLLHTESYRMRARAVAAAIAQEDGVGDAIEQIELAAARHSRTEPRSDHHPVVTG